MDLIKIAIMGLDEAKSLQKNCAKRGVEIILNHNEQTCNRGCSVTVEVHAKESDLNTVQEVYGHSFKKLLEGHDINPEQLNSVYDPSAQEVVCPACGHKFDPKNSECPDCGLAFG